MCSCCSEEFVRWKMSYSSGVGGQWVQVWLCVNLVQCYCEYKHVSMCHVSSNFMGLKILLKVSQNGSDKQFWAMKLYGWSFQAPLLPHPMTNWNALVFTNKPCISAVHFIKTIYTGKSVWCTWYVSTFIVDYNDTNYYGTN